MQRGTKVPTHHGAGNHTPRPLRHRMFQTIYRARTQVEAEMVIALLRASDLHPMDLDTSSRFCNTALDITYHVEVPEDESEMAIAVLTSAERNLPAHS